MEPLPYCFYSFKEDIIFVKKNNNFLVKPYVLNYNDCS